MNRVVAGARTTTCDVEGGKLHRGVAWVNDHLGAYTSTLLSYEKEKLRDKVVRLRSGK